MPEKTGYEQTKVEEVRRILKEEHGVVDEEILKQTKGPLVTLLLELKAEQESEGPQDAQLVVEQPSDENDGADLDGLLEDVEEEPDDAMQPYTEKEAEQAAPAYGSDKWHDYVMRQFEDNELKGDEGAPTCDGCRRVAEQVLGPILVTTIPSNDAPSTINSGTATVVVHLEIQVKNKTHPAHGHHLVREDIADVNKDNCDHPYHKHASATAATRAEGRILRKLLGLRVITAEEGSDAAEKDADIDWTVDEPITEAQITAMDTMCHRINISVLDFINSGKNHYDTINDINKTTANRMMKELNKLQRKTKELPAGVGPYNPNWKNTQGEKES